MKEPIIIKTEVITKIRLEEKYDFKVKMTIGLAESGDFFLIIDFLDLDMDDIKTLTYLGKLQRRLSIRSEVMDQEQYNITHIVVTKILSGSNLKMTWECLSDDPSLYDNLIIK